MSKMIPLKIADMAVESCNKEIARLLFEKAELQGRVIALEAQLESEKAAYKAFRALSFVTVVPSEEYEKLKAEVERLRKAGDMMYSWLGVCGRRNNSFGDDWLRAKKGAMLQAEQFALDMKNKGWTGWNAAKEGKPQS